MNKICLVVPYFGQLPNNFQIWLNSCKANETISWQVFTDDHSAFDYPENVLVHRITFDEFKEKLMACIDFDITIDTPYKLTDYKVAYGHALSEYLKDYDFWGFCDVDLIFGNIRKFITAEILNRHDKILSRGHFTLFRNNEILNTLYKKSLAGQEPYKKVFSSPEFFHFDEWGDNGINRIAIDQGITMYDQVSFHDLDYKKYNFHTSQMLDKTNWSASSIYLWDNGSLFRLYLSQEKLVREEIFYIHFQKRNMKVALDESAPEQILIVPNEYSAYNLNLSDDQLKEILQKRVPMAKYLQFNYNRFKKRFKL